MPFSKFYFHPNLPLISKIHRKKINGYKNSLFALKHSIYGIKIKCEDEVVLKIWLNEYKNTWLKICDFLNFLWITFEKAIMSYSLKIFKWTGKHFQAAVGVVTSSVAFIRRKNI